MMKLSGGERVVYGCWLTELIRQVLLASFPPGLMPHERRCRLYEWMYGEPLPADFPKNNGDRITEGESEAADRSSSPRK